MLKPSFLQTTTFRLALLYAGLFTVSFCALFVFVYWAAEAIATRERQEAIQSDIDGLRQVYEETGLQGLGAAILERTQPDRVGDSIYLLADPGYKPLAGNATSWPRAAEKDDGPWLYFQIDRSALGDPRPHRAEAVHILLSGDYHLMVGRDMRTQERFEEAITRAFAASVAVMLAVAALGGLVMSRTILRRIESINKAAERVRRGEVKHRMPVRGRNDEFDRLADNLNAMLDEIERLMGSIRAVTNNIAHDLRSPLSRLRNRLEAALAESDRTQRRESVERAIGEADELLATFNALLSIADAEAGTGRASLEPVNLEALANDVAELYEPMVEEQGLVFDKSIGGPAVVSGNRQLLFQAVANLVDNAAKYGASGGSVTLSVAPAVNGIGPEIAVADRGAGIPQADRDRVLERFVRLDSSRSTPGNGLGLSLVAAIARLHGATLVLDDNAPGLKASLRFNPLPA